MKQRKRHRNSKKCKRCYQTEISKFKELVTRLKPHLKAWQSEHPVQMKKPDLKKDIGKLEQIRKFQLQYELPLEAFV